VEASTSAERVKGWFLGMSRLDAPTATTGMLLGLSEKSPQFDPEPVSIIVWNSSRVDRWKNGSEFLCKSSVRQIPA
jgi:hypothetical protein